MLQGPREERARETLSHVREVGDPQLPAIVYQDPSRFPVPDSSSSSFILQNHQLIDHSTYTTRVSILQLISTHPICLVRQPVIPCPVIVLETTNSDDSPKGTLVQCDPSIKAIISKINEENGGLYISEDIDDETCLINTKKLDELKQKLKDVRHFPTDTSHNHPLTIS